jgi:hypothetical protein
VPILNAHGSIIFLLVVGGFRPLFAAFMISQGYKCTEWTETLFGKRLCLRWSGANKN